MERQSLPGRSINVLKTEMTDICLSCFGGRGQPACRQVGGGEGVPLELPSHLDLLRKRRGRLIFSESAQISIVVKLA
jgi:hypothetical protein